MSFHIHQPPGWTWRAVRRCARCKTRRRHTVTEFVWYGAIIICCHCGAFTNDGMTNKRKSTDAARARRAAEQWLTAMTRRQAFDALRAEIDEYRQDVPA